MTTPKSETPLGKGSDAHRNVGEASQSQHTPEVPDKSSDYDRRPLEWFKLPHALLLDPRYMRLRPPLQALVINLAMLACRDGGARDGSLPSVVDIAWHLRQDAEEVETDMRDLADLGFLRQVDRRWYHAELVKWQEAKTGAERIRAWRQRQAKSEHAVTERYGMRNSMLPESESESESEQEQEQEQEQHHASGNSLLQSERDDADDGPARALASIGVDSPESLARKHPTKRVLEVVEIVRQGMVKGKVDTPAAYAVWMLGSHAPRPAWYQPDPDSEEVRRGYAQDALAAGGQA